jgi:phosphatidylglycerophosphatase A
MLSSPTHIFSLGFGTGLARFAPGTFGTLIGFPLFWLLSNLPMGLKITTYTGLFTIGCWLCAKTGEALDTHDHSAIVWDEIVAMALVLEFVPQHWMWWLAAFAAFRLFDINKPWPVYLADNAHGGSALAGGFYVMLDDILAAAYSILLLVGVLYLVNWLYLINWL